MDGKPLRYRLVSPDAFVLYSIGFDCADDGGEIVLAAQERPGPLGRDPFDQPDIVWPRAATEVEAQTFLAGQTQAKEEQQRSMERRHKEREREAEERRREIIAQLGDIYAKGETPKLTDPKIEGKLLSQICTEQSFYCRSVFSERNVEPATDYDMRGKREGSMVVLFIVGADVRRLKSQ